MINEDDSRELLVLIFALFGGDAEITQRVLGSVDIKSEVCSDIDALVRAMISGAGALVLAEEALVPAAVKKLTDALSTQASWSDLPIIVSATEGGTRREGLGILKTLGEHGNVSILERPVRVRALVGAVQNALRARRRQYQTRALIADLAAVNRSKDEFLATVSHELRTPLNAMLGWARMLTSGQLDEEKRQRGLQSIERNALAQAQLIEDLLDVSRIVSGKLRLDLLEVSLPKVIDSAIESVRPSLEAKEISLETKIDPDAPHVMGDPNRLQQVAWNLLSNAIKFTPRYGRVELTVTSSDAQVELVVSDNGQGIEPSFLPFLFQRFHQADGGSTRRQGGLGLGLAICRHLIELHGGTIEAFSEGVGQGATMRVRLPVLPAMFRSSDRRKMQPAHNRKLGMACPPELKGLKVLIVDDEIDARELMMSIVTNCGGIAIEAGSAEQAFSAVISNRPDVIVSDIGMPGQDGYSFIRGVRALDAEQGGRIPAAALTAYARAEDRRQALVAGFEMHVPKPVEPAVLLTVVATLARIARAMK